jgi:Matrixin
MIASRTSWKYAAIAVAIVTLSCGGSSTPTAPVTGPPVTGPSIGVGTVLSLRSAETDQPVAGAAISLSGQSPVGAFSRTFTSDAAGQFTLDRTVLLSPTPLVEVTAAGFVTRSTLLRQDETTLTLWPASSSTGLDEDFSSTAVYSASACPAVNTGLSPLRRASASVETIQVTFGTSIQDDAAQAAHQLAISRLNTAIGGALRYELTAAPASGVSFVAEIDPNHATCTAGAEPLRAATELTSNNLTVIGGRLVYCSVNAARSATLVLHELGHTLGLYHSSSTSDVMYCSSGRPAQFSPRERLVMRLARQRRPGNRWPDNDRQASAPLAFGASGTQIIMCGDRGPR